MSSLKETAHFPERGGVENVEFIAKEGRMFFSDGTCFKIKHINHSEKTVLATCRVDNKKTPKQFSLHFVERKLREMLK